VYKVFIHNSFPVLLIAQDTAIRCLDLSSNKKKLAVVDENSNLFVYDLET
jgi:intraflagellar transport protein 122